MSRPGAAAAIAADPLPDPATSCVPGANAKSCLTVLGLVMFWATRHNPKTVVRLP